MDGLIFYCHISNPYLSPVWTIEARTIGRKKLLKTIPNQELKPQRNTGFLTLRQRDSH